MNFMSSVTFMPQRERIRKLIFVFSFLKGLKIKRYTHINIKKLNVKGKALRKSIYMS